MAFLFWKGSFIKEIFDIHLRDSGGEGGNGFGEKAFLVPGESPNILGSLHKTRHHGL